MEAQRVIRAMKQIRRDQHTDYVNKEVWNYIKEYGLMAIVQWPCFVIKITERGSNYIADHSENTED